ncbi:AarF/ABC1/UbiB kinase family protein [Desulfobacter hydrogenophilus]|uniref:AarF/ABC1/UbiB kinase family protein n=1 Tax=Desulfobacter hydrogenophilus TaxID=2291 RepID=A0A328FI90_9BACT|nr:AarF/UbiB family protein [Desulfobacter hydrogenophilus]NDY71128.1 AarF/ABC1/UbiB kinase family protein [Desulfobacter hydrogenophilus]QBH14269.1 AarF/ABC1/UbiB kinase family protein [Desulfobacter hydrogenophilus]RAM02873.1 AarF/ABC1/UbiB kinase family protein [Desulfobacter hydrogenophilus]
MLSFKTVSKVTKRYRHLVRYQQIIGIIFKYGFENSIEAMNIDHYLNKIPFSKPHQKLSRNQRIRMVLEELGPTFIKMGQVLSSRPDLIPLDLTRELAKLQDKVPSFSFEQVGQIILAEFGKPISEVFHSFEESPFASASIGQVHRAELSPDEPVAVKVQRPGIRKIIEVDLEIIHYLAQVMEKNLEDMDIFRPVKIVEEFAQSLEKELDYMVEAANMEQMAEQFAKEPAIHIPEVYWTHSTQRVLCMEFIRGIKADDVEAIDRAGLDRKKITRTGADFVMRQVFEFGFFHADPHPGNIFILENQHICMIDFGMTGFVNSTTRELFIDLLQGLASKNTQKTARLLCRLTEPEESVNMAALEKDISQFCAIYLSRKLEEINASRMIHQFLELCARHGLRIPPDLFLMIKAFISIEGVARTLDPQFDMLGHARPYIRAAGLRKYSIPRLSREFTSIAMDIFALLQTLPSDTSQIITQIKQGKIKVSIKIEGLERLMRVQDQTSNRISFAIIIASLILGSAIVLNSRIPPMILGVSVIGIAGFLAAAVLGVWLLVAIIRRGRL